MTKQHPDPRIIVGATYRDDSHGDEFTIESIDRMPDGSIDVIDLTNGQWYSYHGPEGIIAKMDAGVIRFADAGIVHPAGEEQ